MTDTPSTSEAKAEETELTTKWLSPFVIDGTIGPIAVMKADPGGRYVHWTDVANREGELHATIARLESLLREAVPVVRSMAQWCTLNPTSRETDGLSALADRIDAALTPKEGARE